MDGCSERVREFSMPGYQLKPSDRSKLNWSIEEHRGTVKKLNVMLRDLKEPYSTLFQSNGLALMQGEKFFHSLNVNRSNVWKHQNIRREVMTAYSRAPKQHINKRRKNGNRGKLNETKRKRTENNVQRVYGICCWKPARKSSIIHCAPS